MFVFLRWQPLPPVVFFSILKRKDTALLSIVMPRCCSSSLLSMYRILPAILAEIMLFATRRPSTNVVLPWSKEKSETRSSLPSSSHPPTCPIVVMTLT